MTSPCHLLVHACAACTAAVALVSIALPVMAAPGETTRLGTGAPKYVALTGTGQQL